MAPASHSLPTTAPLVSSTQLALWSAINLKCESLHLIANDRHGHDDDDSWPGGLDQSQSQPVVVGWNAVSTPVLVMFRGVGLAGAIWEGQHDEGEEDEDEEWLYHRVGRTNKSVISLTIDP